MTSTIEQAHGGTDPLSPRRRRRARLESATVGRHWWAGTLVAYALTRVAAVIGFVIAGREQVDWGHDAEMGAWGLMTLSWDGRWYSTIIESGYPTELPRAESGVVAANPWAFYPLFPMTTRLLVALSGMPSGAASLIVAGLGGLAAVILFRQFLVTVAPHLRHERPWFVFTAPLALAAFPSAGVFSAAYSDSLALAVLLGALTLLVSRRYGWFCVCVLALGLARPLAVPIGLVVLVHFWPLVVGHWRSARASAAKSLAWFCVITAVSLVSVAEWPLIAALVTGEPNALFATQSAWVRPGGSDPSVPFSVWAVQLGGGVPAAIGLAVVMVPVLVAARISQLRVLGVEFAAWSLGYLLFIIATVAAGPSSPRYLLPVLVVHAFVAAMVSRWWQAALVLSALALAQCWWVSAWFSNPNTSP